MATPQLLSRNKPNGVAAQSQSTNDAPRPSRSRAPQNGEKVVIRRLPPGMTEDEFVAILGHEWMPGHGKVDWFRYYPGKVSKQSVLCPSRPAAVAC